ncbi:MAG: hypothetical protein JWQ90_2752 [Hydrocarboniphaga sp.]|uniref:hypothetical protein n=1 Tax=Hydrocarboniphaga sp. TaxID=2033016 RepID=UPI002602B2D8|nr:hypothetical protein [Hydrocarboniphaga sp.]MDB5970302.1 hypothetical protein [Hydrocarboniphaga sp.]
MWSGKQLRAGMTVSGLPGYVWAVAPVLLLAAACGSRGPIVDTQNIDQARYKQDLNECQAYAGQVNAGAQAGKGAVGGEQSKDQVVKNCLRGRGYSVLN